MFKSDRCGIETNVTKSSIRSKKRSNQTVAGLKPAQGDVYAQSHAFKSDRCGIETGPPALSWRCIHPFKSDRCGIETLQTMDDTH